MPDVMRSDDSKAAMDLETDQTTEPLLLDRQAVAALLGCSAKHVVRLADSGRMPAPVRLGWLVRWRRDDIARWVAEGCPRRR